MKKLALICTFCFLGLLVFYQYGSKKKLKARTENSTLISENNLENNKEARQPASNRGAQRVNQDRTITEKKEKVSEPSKDEVVEQGFDEMIAKNKVVKAQLKARYHQNKKEAIQFRDNQYVLATDVFAVPKDAYFPNNLPIIEEKYGVYLVYSEDGVPPADSLEVVYNQSSGKFAIYTGIMRITFKEGNTDLAKSMIDVVARDNNYSVLYSYDDSELYMRKGKYEFDSYEEGSFIYKAIQNSSQYDDIIEKISIELVENQRDAN